MKYKIEKKSVKQILKEDRLGLVFYALLFILIAMIGAVYSKQIVDSETMELLQEKAVNIPTKNWAGTSFTLIMYNLSIGLQVITLAITGLPLLFMIANPLLIGGVVMHFFPENGLLGSILLIAPHGIFEIPAMILTAAVSLDIFFVFVMALFKKRPVSCILQAYADAFKVFLLIIVPLSIAAGVIEGGLIVLST